MMFPPKPAGSLICALFCGHSLGQPAPKSPEIDITGLYKPSPNGRVIGFTTSHPFSNSNKPNYIDSITIHPSITLDMVPCFLAAMGSLH